MPLILLLVTTSLVVAVVLCWLMACHLCMAVYIVHVRRMASAQPPLNERYRHRGGPVPRVPPWFIPAFPTASPPPIALVADGPGEDPLGQSGDGGEAMAATTTEGGEAKEDEEEEDLCYACFETRPNTMLIACGHRGLCSACAAHLWHVDRRCPLCRRRMNGVRLIGAHAASPDDNAPSVT